MFYLCSVSKLDDFKNASLSMFEQSMSPSMFEKPEVGKPDFMASTENSWINNNPALNNPFLKGDSGFISPACQSNNHSASSEDSAENHDERRDAVSASSMASNEEEDTISKSPVVVDEEAEEAREVTKLLSGGIMETQFGDLMMSANRETPTPPMEDTGKDFFF